MNEWEFYVGQRVVCIESFCLKDMSIILKKECIYTLKKVKDRGVVVEGVNIEFSKSKFVSISEYRLMKLKEIYE